MMAYDLISAARIAACVILALTFVSAAIPKIRNADEFTGVVHNYRLLPGWATAPFARVLPFIELAVAVCLFLAPLAGSVGAALLLIAFAVAMAINLRRGRSQIDCGCGQSTLAQHLRWALVVRNAGLLLLAALVALPGYAPTASAVLNGVACGLAIVVILVSANTLLALGPVPKRRRIRLLGGTA